MKITGPACHRRAENEFFFLTPFAHLFSARNSHWPVDPTVENQSQFVPPALKRRKIKEIDEENSSSTIASLHLQKTEEAIQDDLTAHYKSSLGDDDSGDEFGSVLQPPVLEISPLLRPQRPWSQGGQIGSLF
jgi:hypothetical protein